MAQSKYLYEDMAMRRDDLYAGAKYHIIADYLKANSPAGGLNILNAGCGSGELSFLLAELEYKVLGIDPEEKYVKLAEEQMKKKSYAGASFRVSSIENFSSDSLFDAVIAVDVLEHIKDDAKAARKLAELARPGGHFILTVPAMPSLFGFHDEEIGHFRRYSARSLRGLIERTGLIDIKKISYFGFTLIPVCLLFSKLLRRPYPISSLGDNKNTALSVILDALLALDKRLPMPFGTSLIFFGIRRSGN